jgi:hypothetical protein
MESGELYKHTVLLLRDPAALGWNVWFVGIHHVAHTGSVQIPNESLVLRYCAGRERIVKKSPDMTYWARVQK